MFFSLQRKKEKKIYLYLLYYQARAKRGRGLFTNKEDTIPGPSDSIGALKMYILEKRYFGTQISMLGFFFLITRRNFFKF